MRKLSYSEAYTEYVNYAAKKENKDINTVIYENSVNGTEVKFKALYNMYELSTAEYYKQLRGGKICP